MVEEDHTIKHITNNKQVANHYLHPKNSLYTWSGRSGIGNVVGTQDNRFIPMSKFSHQPETILSQFGLHSTNDILESATANDVMPHRGGGVKNRKRKATGKKKTGTSSAKKKRKSPQNTNNRKKSPAAGKSKKKTTVPKKSGKRKTLPDII